MLTPASAENFLKGLDYSVLQQCIHCGMCLPTCPTYDETLKETSSPRGRIALMRAVADDELGVTPGFSEEMYFCLGCLACQSVCPADVKYAELIENARAEVRRVRGRSLAASILLGGVFTSRARIRLLARLLRLYQRSGLQALLRKTGLIRLLGRRLAGLDELTPVIEDHFTPEGTFPAAGERRLRVGLLAGCVQDVAFAQVNRDTIEVLRANGCEVVVPAGQQCCGSLHGHNGAIDAARRLACANLDAFPLDSLDAVIVNSAGCGSFMKHYDRLLADDTGRCGRARKWSAMVKDISEFLVDIGFRKPTGRPSGTILATYHDACHLCHGQKIRQQPREILRSIPGIKFIELPESEWCCGSAGIYNITHPELAAKLLDRKIRNIAATGATVVASGNPGCTIQLSCGAARAGRSLSVEHPVSLLVNAYRMESGAVGARKADHA